MDMVATGEALVIVASLAPPNRTSAHLLKFLNIMFPTRLISDNLVLWASDL